MPRILLAVLMLAGLCSCTSTNIQTIESFRAARKGGDLDAARSYLADDPRVWYDAKEGEGNAWNLAGGRYKQWDTHFRSDSNPGPWHVEDSTVWRVVEEWNDYYSLIERQDTPRYRITYFFDDDGKIKGYMISAADPDQVSAPSVTRFDEVQAWAKANHPDEWEYLRLGGSLDPTDDRAERTRTLINKWRLSVGLPKVE